MINLTFDVLKQQGGEEKRGGAGVLAWGCRGSEL